MRLPAHRRSGTRKALGVALLLGLLAAAPVQAATINVTTTTDEVTAGDGQCSLREAISTVNGNGKGDCAAADGGANTIVLGAHTYPLTLAGFLHGGNGTGCLSTFVPETHGQLTRRAERVRHRARPDDRRGGPGADGHRRLQARRPGARGRGGRERDPARADDHERPRPRRRRRRKTPGSFEGIGGAGQPGADGGGILNQGTLTLSTARSPRTTPATAATGGKAARSGAAAGLRQAAARAAGSSRPAR